MTMLHSCRALESTVRGLRESEKRRRKANHGRQGKRPASGAAYVVGWIGEFSNTPDTPCWRFHQFSQPNQDLKRRRCADRLGFRL
jgi:hypothetical protein